MAGLDCLEVIHYPSWSGLVQCTSPVMLRASGSGDAYRCTEKGLWWSVVRVDSEKNSFGRGDKGIAKAVRVGKRGIH